jgi:hypothetical protein
MKWFSLSIGLLVSTLGLADPVVKWQDANGQWHFGTAATAPKQQRTKPVYVERADERGAKCASFAAV